MKILVVGSSGRFGATLRHLFKDNGHEVIGVDIQDYGKLKEELKTAELIFLAVPASVALDIINEFGPTKKIIEISSSKDPFKIFAGKIISIHPLFGPLSLDDQKMRNILFINDISFLGSEDIISGLFPDYNIIPMKSDEHDHLMIELQVIPYVISMLSSRISNKTELKTRSRIIMDQMSDVCSLQGSLTLLDTIRLNPFSKDAIETVVKTIDELRGEIFDNNTK